MLLMLHPNPPSAYLALQAASERIMAGIPVWPSAHLPSEYVNFDAADVPDFLARDDALTLSAGAGEDVPREDVECPAAADAPDTGGT